MIIIGGMCLHFFWRWVASSQRCCICFCFVKLNMNHIWRNKKKRSKIYFSVIWNVGKWTCYIVQARNLLHYKKEMNKRGIRSHRCLLKRKKWNVEDIGVVHWNDILLLLLVADCFGHQCAVGGIMMIWGCHLLAKV